MFTLAHARRPTRIRRMKNNAVAMLCMLLAACGGSGGGGSSSGGGNPPPPPPPAPAPPADTTAPQTRIDAAPAATIYTSSTTLTFSADEAGSTFESRLDGAAFAAVTSPVTLAALGDGAHTYEVRAKDAAGNIDGTPAQAQWIVLAGPPETAIDSSPTAATNSSSATFAFSSNKPDSTFEVSVDGGAFAAAQTPLALTGLATGSHSFAVRATDSASQVDGSPATFNWVVDVSPPAARILFPTPHSYTDAATLTVRGTASDSHGVGSVSVNGVPATSIDGFGNWRADVPLSAISTTVVVSVTDIAGNTTSSADSVEVVNRGPVINDYVGLAWDPNGNQVIALDRGADSVYGYSATTGVGRLISAGPSPTAASGQFSPTVLKVDASRNRALFVDYAIDALVAVDLATGKRTLVSPTQGQGSPTGLAVANDLALDPAGNRAFAANIICNCIVGMNLNNATRSIVASTTVGTGPYPVSLIGLVYDDVTTPSAPRLLTSSWIGPGVQEILAIDIATGNRSVLSSSTGLVGTGPGTDGTMSLTLDAARHRLVTADNYIFGIMAVDLVTGDRSVIMGQHDGSGPLMYPTVGAAYDPVANRLYSKQILEDDIIVTDLVTQERTPFITAHMGSGPAPNIPDAVLVEQTTGAPATLLYTEAHPGAVLRLDLASGARAVVSDGTGNGFGPVLDGIADLVLDTRAGMGNPQALALVGSPNFRLISVDLVTGDRVQVADLNATAPALQFPQNLRLDAANNRVLFTDADYYGDDDALYAVDLTTGARSVVSSGSVGSGPAIGLFKDFVLDTTVSPARVLLADAVEQRYLAVDPATGNRTTFLGPYLGTQGEHQFNSPGVLYLDAENSRLLAVNGGSPSNLFAVSLQDQAQRLVSGRDLMTRTLRGAGPEAYYGGIAFDRDRNVVYASGGASGSLIAVDLVSGDRVIIGN
jgi:hypothetical protein